MTTAICQPVSYGHRPARRWFVRDVPREREEERHARLDFHVTHDDYFATLATILMLLVDAIQTDSRGTALGTRHLAMFDELHDDLMHLQREYRIARKDISL